jgi:hypothetical protein
MNSGEKREIKAEVLMKAFSKFCIDEAHRLKVASRQQDDFLVACVERMTALTNRIEKSGLKP